LAHADAIPAGGEGTVSVTVSVGSHIGRFRHSVVMVTNDPTSPEVELVVTANVQAEIGVSPGFLRFWGSHPGKAQVALRNYTGTAIRLGIPRSSNTYVTPSVSADRIPAGGGVVYVTAELEPGAPVGVLSGWVAVRTDLESVPELRIRISGRLVRTSD